MRISMHYLSKSPYLLFEPKKKRTASFFLILSLELLTSLGNRKILMAKGKLKSMAIKIVSSAQTGFFYVTRKNAKTTAHKLALRKYDPIVRQHVLFTESKLR